MSFNILMEATLIARKDLEKKFQKMNIEELRKHAKGRVKGFTHTKKEFLVSALIDYHFKHEPYASP